MKLPDQYLLPLEREAIFMNPLRCNPYGLQIRRVILLLYLL